MKIKTYLICLLFLGLLSCDSKTKEVANSTKTDIIPIYVEPYYNSQPFKINVGSYSEKLKTNETKELLEVAETIKSNIDKIDVMTLFMLSTRLYDLGLKDEAAYWYYTTGFRRNVFKITVVSDVSTENFKNELDAYYRLLGEYINGYAFGNLEQQIKTLEKVIADNRNLKSLAGAYPEYIFADSELKEAINYSVNDREELIKFIIENKEEIIKKRKWY